MNRKTLIAVLFLGVMIFGGIGWEEYYKLSIPSRIQVRSGDTEEFDFSIPANAVESVSGQTWSLNRPFTMTAWDTGSYEMKVKLLGFIPLKTVQVEAVEEQYAIPCGCPVGIYMKTDGVMVIDSGSIVDVSGNEVSPAANVLQKGDYIEAVNGIKVEDKELLISQIEACGGNAIILTIRRNNEKIDVQILPVMSQDGSYKAGIWVRDDMQGIGTLTYVTEEQFGALGHGVNDIDTGQLVEASNGELHKASIIGITKGSSGNPGSVIGTVDYSSDGQIGTIEYNSESGILGSVSDLESIPEDVERVAVPIGLKQDAHVGKAYIYSDVSGTMERYEIQIVNVNQSGAHSTKSIEICIEDSRLLELTGGIIQGMSGSPIIQDGKLIGAVTHVFVNDPTRGYGIFIEDMMYPMDK